ncbi:MAG: polysaccharide deacetylase family protein [Rectinemataceae bacterium]
MQRRSAAISIFLSLCCALAHSSHLFALEPETLPLAPAAGTESGSSAFDFEDRAFILCWHTFLGKESIPTDFTLAEFAAQIDELRSIGYRFVTMEDLIFGRIRGPLNLVVTIDDGHRTVPSAYEKVLAPRGIVPAIFIYPAVIGTTFFAMKDAGVRELSDGGCIVGAHGYHHLYINQYLYDHDRAMFDEEIFKAKVKVEAITRLPAYIFAYPYGAYSGITIRELKVAGYRFAFAVRRGFVYADSRLNSPYELPRTVVRRDQWADILAFLERNAAGSKAAGSISESE